MAVTPIKDVMNKRNNQLVDNCCVIVERFDQPIVKKKRGRPKKRIAQNKNIPLLLNCDENSVVLNSSGFKPEVNGLQIIKKKRRGRPKQKASSYANKFISKKRKKRKRIFTKIKKRTVNKLEDKKEIILKMSNDSNTTSNVDYGISNNEDTDFVNQVLKENGVIITQPYLCFENVTLGSCNEYINTYVNENKECTSFEQVVPPDFNEVNWNIKLPKRVKSKSFILQRKNECINPCVEDTNILSLNFNKVNWNMIYPKRGKSNSFTNYIVKKPCKNIGEFENLKLKQYSKSVSYLDRGPNIHIKRYDKYELMKIYKTKLRRIRTYPNCLSMDTSALNFLVNDVEYYEGYNNKMYHDDEIFSDNELSSDEEIEQEIHLINNIRKCGFNREYRSKSVPLEQNEKIKKNEKYTYRSIDNLKKLCDISDLHPITFKIPSDKCDLKNIENNNKIRRSKRLNTKNKPINILDEEYFLKCDEPKFDYLMLAQQIRREHEIQLSKARKTDEELENKLKKLDFTLITDNIFRLHKTTNNKDSINCHCKYTKEDQIQRKPGCGSECINRLLNIECGPSCSLMAICTNKQFQNKQFKRTEIVKTPNKGYGLFALEDIPSGTFIDEYIGEVINQCEMINRLQTDLYIENNYMVQLKHDVIIDATCKGNITRFINHSCEPNCNAEKWNVLGESRMGIFSNTLIKKGDEITFDYSFEIFSDTAQQKCYCGTFKCRGYINKSRRNLEDSSCDDHDNNYQSGLISTTVSNKKSKITTNYDKSLLQELDRQLTNISKLKNKNRSDLENSTLNLNKLMVHITDSISQLHILKFIRENDLNCKKLFMSFNGLSILHNWMISNNNNEILKLEIIRTLSDLPISNRNTISKSKVLDIVADWANIPKNVKNIIESLDFSLLKEMEHASEVNRLFPDQNNISPLIHSARNLWKKWIVLKMVFKIPKLDHRPRVNIPNAVDNPLSVSSHRESNLSQLNLEYRSENCNITPTDLKNKLSYVKYGKNETQKYFKSDTTNRFNILQHRIRFNTQQKNQLALEWNKKNWESVSKSNNINNLNSLHGLNLVSEHQEIPVICGLPNKKIKWNTPEIVSSSYEIVPTDAVKFGFDNKLLQTENEFYPIEEIITTDQIYNLSPPSIVELNNEFTLKFVLNMAPSEYTSNSCNETLQKLMSYNEPFLHIMKPENVLYDGHHPSIEDQTYLQDAVKNTNHNSTSMSNTDFINTDTNVIQPRKHFNLEQCKYNNEKLLLKCSLNKMKSARQNYSGLSPKELSFLKRIFKSHSQAKKYGNELISHDFLKNLKVASNCYQNQPSRILQINDILFQENQLLFETVSADESNKTDSIGLAFKFHNEQLRTTGIKIPDIKKLLLEQRITFKHENKFAHKIFNALVKNVKKIVPDKFSLKLSPDTEIFTLDPTKEIELHNELIPTVKYSLCAKLKKNDKLTINLFKKNVIFEYKESKCLNPAYEIESIPEKNSVLLKSFEETNTTTIQYPSKRKLPLPYTTNKKRKKIVDVSLKNFDKSKDETITQIPFVLDKNDDFHINNIYSEKKSSTSNEVKNYSALKTNAITSRQIATINYEITDDNELKDKPFMKCLPFQQIDGISDTLLQNNIAHLATYVDFSPDVMSTRSNNELINPIVDRFKNSIGFKRISGRSKLVDDPIVRDYLQSVQSQAVGSTRKFKLPESLMSLPNEILNLVPDNQAEIKCVVDFYHNMATVIVKILDSYVKKNCKQGRIRTDADFKYLAKKLNSNILYKELQAKRIHELRITEHMKEKVKQYIITYMLKFGKVYRKRSID